MSPAQQLSLLDKPSSLAMFSPCRKYRYTLWRKWAADWESNFVMFIGLNPSTADEVQDDPTIRRCVDFAQTWGYSALLMTNLFAYRATNPKDMMQAEDPIGVENDRFLAQYAGSAKAIVAAWGNHGTFGGRYKSVVEMIPVLYCLKVAEAGMPSHPLYLPKGSRLLLYKQDSQR